MHVAHLSLFMVTLVSLWPANVCADEVRSREEFVVNGQPVAPDEVRGTVMVSLLDSDSELDEITTVELRFRPYCSGVLIAPTVVLTAAHCLEDCIFRDCSPPDDCCASGDLRAASTLSVTPGVRTIDDLRVAEPVGVREALVFEGYRPSGEWRAELGECELADDGFAFCTEPGLSSEIHDVAILLLDAPINSLNPVRLLQEVEGLESSLAIATGYGERTVPDSEELLEQDEYHSILHQSMTPIERVTEHEILTAAGENVSGTCFGDSGGPLYVQRGGGLFVAGVSSRLRTDRESPRCGEGAIYTSTAAYASWIFEVAPETIPVQSSGGCSVSSRSGELSGSWLLGLMLLVLCLPVARRRVVPFAFVLTVLAFVGCGSSDETSFCTERYDPLGVACDPEVERTDLLTAEALARAEVPEDAWLWDVRASYSHVDPDGNAASWTLSYYLPGDVEPPAGRALQVVVRGTTVDDVSGPRDIELNCIPSRAIQPFDSRAVIQDTIRRIEETGVSVQIQEPGDLHLVQNHRCGSPSLRLSGTSYRVPEGFYYVGYDEFGQFLELRYWEPTE